MDHADIAMQTGHQVLGLWLCYPIQDSNIVSHRPNASVNIESSFAPVFTLDHSVSGTSIAAETENMACSYASIQRVCKGHRGLPKSSHNHTRVTQTQHQHEQDTGADTHDRHICQLRCSPFQHSVTLIATHMNSCLLYTATQRALNGSTRTQSVLHAVHLHSIDERSRSSHSYSSGVSAGLAWGIMFRTLARPVSTVLPLIAEVCVSCCMLLCSNACWCRPSWALTPASCWCLATPRLAAYKPAACWTHNVHWTLLSR